MNQFVKIEPKNTSEMPDIASSAKAHHAIALDWVGMGQIALPLNIQLADRVVQTNGTVDCFVNLNHASVKGIHMSRLYLLLNAFAQEQTITPNNLYTFIAEMLKSHEDISDQARVIFNFPLLLERPALKSNFSGWKSYPCGLEARLAPEGVQLLAHTQVAYSSTCPCSAALARQLVQTAFSTQFSDQDTLTRAQVEQWLRSENGSFATPHSQRSEAYVEVVIDPQSPDFSFITLIDQIENALGTPVQTAVKREDEQEFARLNGHNLMFCEDAARTIAHCLNQLPFSDYRAKVSHYESLHAHDAISMTSKGIQNGMSW